MQEQFREIAQNDFLSPTTLTNFLRPFRLKKTRLTGQQDEHLKLLRRHPSQIEDDFLKLAGMH